MLTKYAVTTRYPGEDEDPTPQEMKHGLRIAEKVYREILKRLPRETHPLAGGNKPKKKGRLPAVQK